MSGPHLVDPRPTLDARAIAGAIAAERRVTFHVVDGSGRQEAQVTAYRDGLELVIEQRRLELDVAGAGAQFLEGLARAAVANGRTVVVEIR